MLLFAIITITMALIFYSIGVWSEKLQGSLKKWHVIIFWAGLVFDTIGTTTMNRIAGGSFTFDFHGTTGLIAILLMMFHAIWATWVLRKGSDESKQNFHKFSIIVWAIWLLPFLSGMIFGITTQ